MPLNNFFENHQNLRHNDVNGRSSQKYDVLFIFYNLYSIPGIRDKMFSVLSTLIVRRINESFITAVLSFLPIFNSEHKV